MKFSDTDNLYRVRTQLESHLSKLASEIDEYLRRPVSVLTTGCWSSYKWILPRDLRSYKLLCCVVHYMKSEVRELLLLELREGVKSFEPFQRTQLLLLLEERYVMINTIFDSTIIAKTVPELFGFILAPHSKLVNLRVKKHWEESEPIRPQYHRGYRDKGSRVPIHQRHEDYANDYTSKNLQLEIERIRRVITDSILLNRD